MHTQAHKQAWEIEEAVHHPGHFRFNDLRLFRSTDVGLNNRLGKVIWHSNHNLTSLVCLCVTVCVFACVYI